MSMVAMGCLLYSSMYLYYARENRKRASGERDDLMEGKSEEEVLALGDESPRFVFAK